MTTPTRGELFLLNALYLLVTDSEKDTVYYVFFQYLMEVIDLEPGWLALLHDCFTSSNMNSLKRFLQQERHSGAMVFPPSRQIFHAFWQTPLAKVQVVILGQDPYHDHGQAHGLCFSVPAGVAPPPSLVNIHKEMFSDLGIDNSGKGNLEQWAHQGVLLLNSVLTVRAHQPASHRNQGWEEFTDEVIVRVSSFHNNLVFLLWGSYAQKKGAVIPADSHCIIHSAHPSPLSANKGFFNSRPFSRANEYLSRHNKKPIDWKL